MPVETLTAASPVTVPAKTYDKVWIEEIVIAAPDPNGDASARVRMRLFTEVEGKKELLDKVHFVQADGLLSNAAADADLDAAVTHLMAYVGKVAVQEGIVAAPTPEPAE